MVSEKSVEQQLKRIGFERHGWGKGELDELHRILLPGEEIYECVNGIYEGGFALLVATDVRVLLIDKKPLKYLTVEDLRFDMINEMDYSHRLFGAQISIATGSKNLRFRSYNQPRLRKLIGHVQHCMAESKKKQTSHQEDQNQHLEKLNQQLQTYLMQQQQYQLQLQRIQLAQQLGTTPPPPPEPVKPSPELADYLFAQSLLSQHQAETGRQDLPINEVPLAAAQGSQPTAGPPSADSQLEEIYADGLKEVFGRRPAAPAPQMIQASVPAPQPTVTTPPAAAPLDVNAMRIAYSKLPMALRNRKFGRPSFHAHSQAEPAAQPTN